MGADEGDLLRNALRSAARVARDGGFKVAVAACCVVEVGKDLTDLMRVHLAHGAHKAPERHARVIKHLGAFGNVERVDLVKISDHAPSARFVLKIGASVFGQAQSLHSAALMATGHFKRMAQMLRGQKKIVHERRNVGKHVRVDALEDIKMHVVVHREGFHAVGVVDVAFFDLRDLLDLAVDHKLLCDAF